MAPVLPGSYIWRDFVLDGVPSSGFHKPDQKDIRPWSAWVESIISAFTTNGGLIYATKAAMDADLAHAVNTMAWVIGDPVAANNGVYGKLGASGSGSWSRRSDLPFSFIVGSNVGAGTENAISATTAIPVSASALVWVNIAVDNTASPVTISFNGGAPLTVKSNSGNDIVPGGLKAGMIIAGVVSGANFRILSDQVSASIIAAAEAAQVAAAASAATALAAAAGVSLPPTAPNRMLVDAPDGLSRLSKTFAEVRALLEVYSISEIAGLLDLKSDIPRRGLSGLEPEKQSGTVLRLQPGSAVNSTGTRVRSAATAITIDLMTVGAGGMDTGAPANTVGYFIYLIEDNVTGALSAVASASITYGGVIVPAGYTIFRKLPWGFVYRTAAGYGVDSGIPDFHLSCWPKPYTQFTAAQIASPFIVLNASTSTSFVPVDLTNLVPDNARLARIMCRTRYATAAGTAYVRTYPTQSTGIPVGMASVAGQADYSFLDIRRYSGGEIYAAVTGGVDLTLAVQGFYNTEPS